jgi:hypothetical protein
MNEAVMNEDRDQQLAELFASNTAELSGEEFGARIRRRIERQAAISRLRKIVLVLALIGIGAAYSAELNNLLVDAQSSIEQSLQQLALEFPLGTTIGEVTLASFTIGFIVWRRIRRRI